MRVFLALTPDERLTAALAALQERIRTALGASAADWRWPPPGNVHLTLHFLGELDDGRVEAVVGAVTEPVSSTAFDASVDELGAFPPRGAPRVLWAGIGRGRSQLLALHRELGDRLRSRGCDLEDRTFHPHLTLARARARHPRLPAGVLSIAGLPDTWRIASVELYRSDLSGPTPRYEVLARLALATPDAPSVLGRS